MMQLCVPGEVVVILDAGTTYIETLYLSLYSRKKGGRARKEVGTRALKAGKEH